MSCSGIPNSKPYPQTGCQGLSRDPRKERDIRDLAIVGLQKPEAAAALKAPFAALVVKEWDRREPLFYRVGGLGWLVGSEGKNVGILIGDFLGAVARYKGQAT